MVLITDSRTISWTSVHSSSGTQSDLVPWIYLSLPLYNHKGFDLGHTEWSSGFPYFLQFKSEFALISHASKVMHKILQARLQQYVNRELPDVQAGFRKGRGTRDQIANIRWIIEQAREFQKNIYSCFIDYAKVWLCGSQQTVENCYSDGNTRPPYMPPEKPVCRSRSNSQNWTGHGTTNWF